MVDSVAVFPPGFRVLDSNGAPVNNAKINFREPGPAGTKTVYSDATLSTSLGSTVRTRADGFPVAADQSTPVLIYLGSDAYYVEITDEDDVPIWPAKDNVKGAVDTSDFVTSDQTSILVQPVEPETADRLLDSTDKGKVINGNAGGGFFTLSLDAPATLGDGWNVKIRNGGTSNQVGIAASPALINTSMGDMLGVSLRPGEAIDLACDGAGFKVTGYCPPLISGTFGVIIVTDRVSVAPVGPVAGARYIVTAPFSTFEAEDIIEATGQGTFFEITPPADCGWIAYVVDEAVNYQFRGSAWALLSPALATQAEMETGTSLLVLVTPGRQHFHPGHAKCWALVTVSGGTPTLNAASYNMAGIVDTGVGDIQFVIATDFSSAAYAALITAEAPAGAGHFTTIKASSRAAGTISSTYASVVDASLADPASWHFAGFGDQA